ncbi:MAG: hypothetical protein SynsKO_28430 [Synoicihabitans sp.]
MIRVIGFGIAHALAAGILSAATTEEIEALLTKGEFDEALPMLKAQVDAGDARSALLLGILHTVGAGVAIDHDEAKTLFTSASNGGNIIASIALDPQRQFVRTGESDPPLPPNLAVLNEHGLVFRFRDAIAWSQSAATEHDPAGLFNIAHFTWFAPNLVNRDRSEYIPLLEKAAEHSQKAGETLLTIIRYESDNYAVDHLDDMALARRLADQGSAIGKIHLAEGMLDQDEINTSEVLDLVNQAADSGLQEAVELRESLQRGEHESPEVSESFRDEFETESDKRKIAALVDQVRVGDLDSQYALSELIELSHQSDRALSAYGRLLLQDRELRLTKPDDYISRLLAAGERGNPEATYLAGTLLLRGRWGLTSDAERAVTILEESGRAGFVPSQLTIYHHHIGNGAKSGDFSKADALAEEFRAFGSAFDRARTDQYAKLQKRLEDEIVIPSEAELVRRIDELDRDHGGGNLPPTPVFRAKPIYPYELRRRGIEGTVTISFVVDSKGRVREPEAISPTEAEFASAAKASIQKWRFAPGVKKGKPVNTRMQVPIVFSITDD